MLKVPPALHNWKQTQQQSTQITPNIVQPQLCQSITTLPPQHATTVNDTSVHEIDVILFKHDGNEMSVTVENGLNINSTLEAVMKEGDVANEFGLDISLGEGEPLTTPTQHTHILSVEYKFCIQRNNGSSITFFWNKI